MQARVKENWQHWGLCAGCSRSMILRYADNRERVYCHAFPESTRSAEVEKPVTSCTSFDEKGRIDLYAMRGIATIIEIGQRGEIGFIRPRDPGHKEIVEKIQSDLE